MTLPVLSTSDRSHGAITSQETNAIATPTTTAKSWFVHRLPTPPRLPDPRPLCERQTGGVPQVDPTDDTIERYIVRRYAYDATRRERRHVVVGAFDNEAEGLHCVAEAHTDLLERRAAGLADDREHITMVFEGPGYAERIRARRIEEKLTRWR
jgi:hypothetical protein